MTVMKLKKKARFSKSYLARVGNIFDKTSDLVYIKDTEGNFVYRNGKYLKFCEQLAQVTKNKDFEQNSYYKKSHLKDLGVIKKNKNLENLKEKYLLKANKVKTIYLLTSKSPLYNEQNEAIGILNISKNISDLERENDQIRYYATHDPLTGFLNKPTFRTKFLEEINRCRRTKEKLAILYIDLDEFKEVNDNYGHISGDFLLKVLSRRLKKMFRTTDYLCRFGGDEFVILLTSIKRDGNFNPMVESLIEKINKEISKPIKIHDNEVVSSASIGYSLYPDNGEDINTLINKSDLEMYKVKKKKSHKRI